MGDRIEFNEEPLKQIINEWIQMRNRYVELTDTFRQMAYEFRDYKNVDILTLLMLCARLEASIRKAAEKLQDIINTYYATEAKAARIVARLPMEELFMDPRSVNGLGIRIQIHNLHPDVYLPLGPGSRPGFLLFKNEIQHEYWLIQALGLTSPHNPQ